MYIFDDTTYSMFPLSPLYKHPQYSHTLHIFTHAPHTIHTLTDIKEKDSDDSGVGDHDAALTDSLRKGFKAPEIVAEEYKAIDSFEAEGPGQVSFEAGSSVHVLDKMEDGKKWLVVLYSYNITLFFVTEPLVYM